MTALSKRMVSRLIDNRLISSGFLVAVVLALFSHQALGTPMGAEARALNSTRGDPTGSVGSVYAEAGNVTELEINGTQLTKAWQGFFGNITGNITLEDSSGHQMYDWTMGDAQGEVYASRNNAITWADVNCSTTETVVAEETAMGMTDTDNDNISATFRTTDPHPTFNVGTFAVNATSTCYTTHTYVSGEGQDTAFPEVMLNDSSGRVVWVTLINESTTGFDGVTHDFQMLVPEDGHTDAQADIRTQYYFWVELS
ncbi:MAG: hypothetical protein KKG59_00900 [Nanoarchaeota archaeon]|nr:hypothetical protein [Nanoarchaeota archaeon]